MTNLYTPDRDINPPNDNNRYSKCDGEGIIMVEIESEDPNEDFDYDTETCQNCKGTGFVDNY